MVNNRADDPLPTAAIAAQGNPRQVNRPDYTLSADSLATLSPSDCGQTEPNLHPSDGGQTDRIAPQRLRIMSESAANGG